VDSEVVKTKFIVQNDLCVGCGLCVDACSMEHSISKKTIATIIKFVEYTENDPEGKKLIENFKLNVNK